MVTDNKPEEQDIQPEETTENSVEPEAEIPEQTDATEIDDTTDADETSADASEADTEEPVEETVTETSDEPVSETAPVEAVAAAEMPATTSTEAALETDDEDFGMVPRGALIFVMLMLAYYVFYWFVTWFEIFILRGA